VAGAAGMAPPLSLRAALKEGALVTAANWPVVLVDFGLWTLYEFALAVPVLGGAFMVNVLFGFNVASLVGQGLGETADAIIGALGAAPGALAAFVAAAGLVAAGGLILIFVVKGGTLAVLVAGERAAGDLHRAPLHVAAIQRASAWSVGAVYDGARRFGRRMGALAAWLCATYLLIGSLALAAITFGFRLAADAAWAGLWPVFVLLATSSGLIAVTVANLMFDLLRVVILTDDCRLVEAFGRVRRFLVARARQVIGVFAVTSGIFALAAAGWLVATANVALIGFVPVAGLLVAPLQAAIWVVRGVLVQYLGLATLSAYQTQYRRFQTPAAAAPAPLREQTI